MTAAYESRYFYNQDNLRLHFRDYDTAGSGKIPVLCLAGLTRNSKDFHTAASRISATRRVLALDYRGRGLSQYDPDWRRYEPPNYIADALQLLASLGIERVIVLGTSLGGILAMGLSAARPCALAGAILNDIGPDIVESGRQRIAQYVGQDVRAPTLEAAADIWKQQFSHAFPKLGPEGWLRIANGTFTHDSASGGYRLDYDLAISRALKEGARRPLPDLWPLFRGLRDIPTLVLRGELSDILNADTLSRMQQVHNAITAVTVPDVGHVPMLDEPAAQNALDQFLESLP